MSISFSNLASQAQDLYYAQQIIEFESSEKISGFFDLNSKQCVERASIQAGFLFNNSELAHLILRLITNLQYDPFSLITNFKFILDKKHFPYPEFLQYYIALAYYELGDDRNFAIFARFAIRSSRLDDSLEDQLTYKQLRLFFLQKKFLQLLDNAQWILALGKNPLFREKTNYMAALAARELGRSALEVSYLEKLAANYPISEEANYAFDRLVALSCDIKKPYYFSFSTLKKIAFNSHLEAGVVNFLESIKSTKIRKKNGSIGYLTELELLEFYFTMRLYDILIYHANEILANTNLSKKDLHRVYYFLGKALLRRHDYKAAATYFSILINEKSIYVKDGEVKEFLADALAYDGALDTASKIYKNLNKVKANSILQWHFIWSQYLNGTYESIEQYFSSENIKIFPERDRFYQEGRKYWFAKVLHQNGKKEKAEKMFKEVLDEAPDNIYAYYIAKSYPDLLPEDSFSLFYLEKDIESKSAEVALQAEQLDPLLYLYSIFNTPETVISGLKISKNFISSSEYSILDKINSPANLLSNKAKELINTKIKNRQNWHTLMRQQKNDPELWQQYYPLAYHHQVKYFSEILGIDPYLILSIMRSESEYIPFAESQVGALGLMQIMPFTGFNIARRLDFTSFKISDLLNPNINIAFAAWYIKNLLEHYQMHPTLAVAAYNAGPAFVDTWLKRCKKCTAEEFIETIPFKETRQYVKKTLRHYLRYVRIYDQIKIEDLAFLKPLPKAGKSLDQLF